MLWNAKNGSVLLNDTDMDFVSFGHGEKTLILLPGLSDGLSTVKGKALLLAPSYQSFFDKYTVYMFSRKNAMPDGYAIRDMAADQAFAMRSLGIEKASVLGVSEGGMIAQYLTADDPELVESLVLAVTAPCANDLIRENVQAWIAMAEARDHKQLMIDTAEKSYSDRYLKRFRKLYPAIGLIGRPKTYRRFLIHANAILTFDARPEVKKINCPTLIIGGSDDKVIGVQASFELHKRIPGSRIHIYDGLGHAAYEEAPDFNTRVLEFLEASR